MDMRNLPDALFAIMKRHGWSQYDLARELGVPQSWVWRAASGSTDPGIARTARLLKRVGWEVRISPKWEDDDPVKRREFVAAAASVTFVPSSKTSPYQDPEFVDSLARCLARRRMELGGVPLVSTAMGQLKRLESAINSRDRSLQTAASRHASQTALVLYDARKLGPARHVGEFALALGQRTGDRDAQVNAYGILSQISVYGDDAARGAMYAERGLRLADLCDEDRAVLSVRLGRAYAITSGAARECHALLDQAREIDCGDRSYALDVVGNTGLALEDLGCLDAAETLLGAATRMSSSWSTLYCALYMARQIEAALRATQPWRAAELMATLARTAPLVTSLWLDVAISDILTLSSRWAGVPEIRDAREALQATQSIRSQ